MSGNWGLIDPDTPHSVYTKKSYADPTTELQLIFSDEFNVDGRSFYPGDDPYWEAIDLHYWQVCYQLPVTIPRVLTLPNLDKQFGMVRPSSSYHKKWRNRNHSL